MGVVRGRDLRRRGSQRIGFTPGEARDKSVVNLGRWAHVAPRFLMATKSQSKIVEALNSPFATLPATPKRSTPSSKAFRPGKKLKVDYVCDFLAKRRAKAAEDAPAEFTPPPREAKPPAPEREPEHDDRALVAHALDVPREPEPSMPEEREPEPSAPEAPAKRGHNWKRDEARRKARMPPEYMVPLSEIITKFGPHGRWRRKPRRSWPTRLAHRC